MSPPKHLWSGDWQRESDAAAQERANRVPSPPSAEPAPPALPARSPVRRPARVAAGPSLRARLGAALVAIVRAVRDRRARLRFALLVALAALVVVGAAYGVSTIGRSDSGSAVAGQAPWLGLEMGISPSGAVVVSSVASGGPAAAAGLKAGDVIIQFDSRPVVTPIDVTEGVDALLPGDQVELQVQRGSATYLVQATVRPRPAPSP